MSQLKRITFADKLNKNQTELVIPAWVINLGMNNCQLCVIKNETEVLSIQEIGIQSFVLLDSNHNSIDIKISTDSLSKLLDHDLFIMDIVLRRGAYINDTQLNENKRKINKCTNYFNVSLNLNIPINVSDIHHPSNNHQNEDNHNAIDTNHNNPVKKRNTTESESHNWLSDEVAE